jgi:hypothetical protein
MEKVRFVVVALILLTSCLSGEIVINEILYDAISTDTGNEWIELYNNGTDDVNLEGAQLQVAGLEFTTVFTFPSYVLRAGRYVLIGEANITQAVFITPLVMQNGGDETDGVRYVSPDNLYTDTVLYDSPNTNNLTNDYGSGATLFAIDVAAGSSLARVVNGMDTNDCSTDFAEETNPTPGLPNRTPIDYSLLNPGIIFDDYVASCLECTIQNNSWAYSDTLDIRLDVTLNGQLLHSFPITPLLAWEYYEFSESIFVLTTTTGLLQVELVVYNDANPDDNIWSTELGESQFGILRVNEIMYNPETDNQEWVELLVPNWVSWQYFFTLSDAAGNETEITLPALCPEYLVLCEDQALLMTHYPECPADAVLQISNLPALNNEGDYIILKDNYGVVMDSMSYVGVTNRKDISLERQVSADSTITWHYCLAPAGGTPGQPNSEVTPPPGLEAGHVRLIGSPFNPDAGESMYLEYSLSDEANFISCYVFDLNGIKRHTIASGLDIGSSGELFWNGKDGRGKALPRGIYVLLVEARNSSKNIILRKQLTVVLATK